MIQIIDENKRPSFAQSIMGGIAENAPKAFEQYQSNQRNAQANKIASELMGFDVSGFDPETRKALMVEKFKQEGKFGRQNQQQEFLSNLMGGKSDKSDTIKTPDESKAFNPMNISDQDIIISENLGIKGLRESKNAKIKELESDKKETRRSFEADRDYHSKTTDPILKEAQAIIKEAPIKKGLIAQQRRDIASGNTSGIIPFLVDSLGLEAYRNPESARFKNVVKNQFVETVHSLGSGGARMNQFLERTLSDAQPRLGRDEESNNTVLDLQEFVDDLKTERAKIELDLAEQDMKEYGYAKNDIGIRADKLMDKFAEQRQDEMAYDIRKRHEDKMDDAELSREIVSKSVPPDTPLTLRVARILMIKNNDDEKKAQAEAKRLGFKIPTEQTYMRK